MSQLDTGVVPKKDREIEKLLLELGEEITATSAEAENLYQVFAQVLETSPEGVLTESSKAENAIRSPLGRTLKEYIIRTRDIKAILKEVMRRSEI